MSLPRHIREELARIGEQTGEDDGETFCHFALQTLYGLDDEDAAEACTFRVTSGQPGAFWHDEEGGRVVLAEAHHRVAKTRIDRRSITELTHAWSSLDPDGEGTAPPALRETAAIFAQARESDPELSVELLYAGAGSFASAAVKYARTFNEEHAAKRIQLRLVGLEELNDADFERRSREAGPLDEPITLRLRHFFEENSEDGDPPTLVASIEGLQLAEIEQEHRFRIFQRNVRYQLPGKINKNIDRTLKDPDGRRKFWYYNNGISILCDEYDLDAKRSVVHVENLQIVNGCQTTTTLGANLDQLEDPAPMVLVRIIASKDEDLQRAITVYNNRQNAVRDRDLLSNDPIQEKLQKTFAELDPPWYYERKRGAWKAEVSPSQRKRFAKRVISNEKAAQAAYAFHYDPGEARARKRFLFVTRREDPNGFYELLFNRTTTPQWLLLPYRVNEFVTERKRDHLQRIREAEKKPTNRRSVADKLALQRGWISFGDQVLAGAIGFYWRQRIQLTQKDLAVLLDERLLEALLLRSYALALRDLSTFFNIRMQEARDRKQVFVPTNYLKGNWSVIRDWLETQEDYRETVGEDPFAAFDLLAQKKV